MATQGLLKYVVNTKLHNETSCLSPAPPRIHWSTRLHCSSGSWVCMLILFKKEAIRHTIRHNIVSFIFRYSQPVAGMPQTGATVATATSYPGTEQNVPYMVAMLMYCSHHAFLPLPPPPLSSFSPPPPLSSFLSLLHLLLCPNLPMQTIRLLVIRRSNSNKLPMVRTPTHSSRLLQAPTQPALWHTAQPRRSPPK